MGKLKEVRDRDAAPQWAAFEPLDVTTAHGPDALSTMDWNSRRITAILENALNEDRATSDATSYACIDPNQRASATIVAKQECILAGLGCVPRILDVYAALDGAVTSHYEVTSHPSIFDGIRLRRGSRSR